MSKRLAKVAQELNVGIPTIVEFLNHKGLPIENKPTSMVTEDMENLLLKEFQKDVADKERASQMTIGNRPILKREIGKREETVQSAPTPAPPPASPFRRDDVFKTASPFKKEELKPQPPVVAAPPPTTLAEVKEPEAAAPVIQQTPAPVPAPLVEEKPIINKVDSDHKSAPVQKETKVEAPPVELPAAPAVVLPPAPAPVAPPPEPVMEKPVEIKETKPTEAVKPMPPTEAKPVGTATPQAAPAPKPAEPRKQQRLVEPVKPKAEPMKPKVEPTPQSATKIVKEPEKAPEEQPNETPDDEVVRMSTPELRGLKILGRIDVSKKQEPTKSKGKGRARDSNSRGDGRDNRGGRGGTQGGQVTPGERSNRPAEGGGERSATDNRGEKNPNDNRGGERNTSDNRGGDRGAARGGNTTPGQARGREDDRRPKPVASSDNQDAKKRKRKRRSSDTGGPQQQQNQQQQQQQPNTGGNRTGGVRGGVRRDGQVPASPDRQQATNRETSDQIRRTMISLSGAGKRKGQKMRRDKRDRMRERQEMRDAEGLTSKLQVTEFVTVQELANMMDVTASEVIMACMGLGVFVSINQRLDAELIELVASEFDHQVEFISVEEQTDTDDEDEDAPEDLLPRAPVVTVMGHVDHGKTSLLDHIRKANVVSGEAGGITQHIGAYEVIVEGRGITFLDTPGHEAFTAMRARGTKVTDIAIIVIAADDNIMPQTKEAISHAQAAGVPMIFAINKIDKAGAQPEKIKQELASMNLLVEDWGGTYQSEDISAKAGTGIDQLLEKVLLVADMAELKANPNRNAIGSIIEASLDKGKGYVAKILVQNGTLKESDPVVAGEYSGKVKAMFNERNQRIKIAGPSTPVLVLGLSGAPTAGEKFKVMNDESEARQLANRRAQLNREQANRATKRISLDEIGRRLALGNFKELNLIVKGDVDGSVEALSDSLIKLSIEKVQVNVIHRAVGQIVESDVLLATASDAIIIGFQVRPSLSARKLAEREGVEIKTYSIIYEAIEEVKLAIEGMLEPTKEEKIVCNIEVREIYKNSKIGTIAGCYMLDGKVTRNTSIRIIRDGIVVFPSKEGAAGEISSLKRYKDDIKEVKTGMECGITIKNFNDIKVGDVIEGFEITEVKQKYG